LPESAAGGGKLAAKSKIAADRSAQIVKLLPSASLDTITATDRFAPQKIGHHVFVMPAP
jgi:hypothetical protein